ncbi:MAG: hypothetical protein D6732_29555 [Methanobacteriota archaeon]|nr:MAG: hypothetical protein D6732_29555 [Euryarchaeota archaeon]
MKNKLDILKLNSTRILAGGLILILLIALTFISASPYAPNHSILRQDDLGASRFKNDLQSFLNFTVSRIVISPLYLRENKDVKLMVLIGAERKYTTAELAAYHDFVNNGGILVIFEDYGNAREVAGTFGLTYMDGVLRETNPFLFTNSPDKPLVFERFISSQLGDFAINPIQLNRATAVVDIIGFLDGTAYPILFTDKNSSAFLDLDDDNLIDSSDKVSPLPIGVLKLFGEGIVVAFGDASLPLNLYWQQKGRIGDVEFILGNAIFVLLLIGYLASIVGTTHVYFDETHLQPQFNSFLGLTSWFISVWIGLSSGQGLTYGLGIIALAVGLNRYSQYRRKRKLAIKDGRVEKVQINYISNPTRAERLISEFYILYQYMGDRILHTANQSLLKKIEENAGDFTFRKYLEQKYGRLSAIKSVETLWKINHEINEYISQNIRKWL